MWFVAAGLSHADKSNVSMYSDPAFNCVPSQEVSCSPDAIAFDGMILKDIPETFFQVLNGV